MMRRSSSQSGPAQSSNNPSQGDTADLSLTALNALSISGSSANPPLAPFHPTIPAPTWSFRTPTTAASGSTESRGKRARDRDDADDDADADADDEHDDDDGGNDNPVATLIPIFRRLLKRRRTSSSSSPSDGDAVESLTTRFKRLWKRPRLDSPAPAPAPDTATLPAPGSLAATRARLLARFRSERRMRQFQRWEAEAEAAQRAAADPNSVMDRLPDLSDIYRFGQGDALGQRGGMWAEEEEDEEEEGGGADDADDEGKAGEGSGSQCAGRAWRSGLTTPPNSHNR